MPERTEDALPPREPGDDVEVTLRVRKANLPALESGVTLGIEKSTGEAITLQWVKGDDGVYEQMVVTGLFAKLATPEPVDA